MSYARNTNPLHIVCVLASSRVKWFCASAAFNGITKSVLTLRLMKPKIGSSANTA